MFSASGAGNNDDAKLFVIFLIKRPVETRSPRSSVVDDDDDDDNIVGEYVARKGTSLALGQSMGKSESRAKVEMNDVVVFNPCRIMVSSLKAIQEKLEYDYVSKNISMELKS